MSVGSREQPLRVAVVGSGPAGFYAAEHLLDREDIIVHVDMFERLPMPYGLVRFGVAPDHEKIKNVTRTFDKKVGTHQRFRFFGNVDVGVDITLADLQSYYHQVCFASGAPSDRHMGIPGEDLQRSHPATEFVAWYNGHPDYRDYVFDLSVRTVVVVGVGNVAVDVARILCRTIDELAKTDIADYALEQLSESQVKEVIMLGRRGPAQAAFTNPEIRELGVLPGADIRVVPSEVQLDPLSAAQLEAAPDRTTSKKIEILQSFAERERTGKSRTLTLRFLVSPTEIIGDAEGRVSAIRVQRNELVERNGRLAARATEHTEELPAQMVFRSVGYRGLPIPGLPFDEAQGIVPHTEGRVIQPDGTAVTGCYVSGWIKRGPSGVIGTNKPDGAETAATMLADCARGNHWTPSKPPNGIDAFLAQNNVRFISFEDWKRLDALEIANGKRSDRPRLKFTRCDDALAAIAQPVTTATTTNT